MLPLSSKRQSEAGIWEEERPDCTNCNKLFSMFNRRHHCRVCGHVFCSGCTAYRVHLSSSRTGRPKRCCAQCFAISGAGGGYEPLSPSPSRAPVPSMLVGKADLQLGDGRKTASELGLPISADSVLAEIRKPLGFWNWALFHPTATLQPLSLYNAGSLSVNGAYPTLLSTPFSSAPLTLHSVCLHSSNQPLSTIPHAECSKFLLKGETLYGLLRLGFGQGRFRRTKTVLFTWMPTGAPSLTVAQRKKMAEARGSMLEKLGAYSFEVSATVQDDLSLKTLLDKSKKVLLQGEAMLEEEELSAEAFYSALEEEAKASQTFFEAGGAAGSGAGGGGGLGGRQVPVVGSALATTLSAASMAAPPGGTGGGGGARSVGAAPP
jgi:hypothetical protein